MRRYTQKKTGPEIIFKGSCGMKESEEINPKLTPWVWGSNEAVKQAILAGLGISALSRNVLTLNQPGQFAVLDAEGFPILRHWYAVYPAGRQLSVVAQAFLDYLLGRGDAAPAAIGEKK